MKRLNVELGVKKSADDFQLVEDFRQGDESVFQEIVRRYERQIANLIYLTLGTREGVEDLTQEVFIRVYKSLARFEQDASLFSWIYRIAVNLCIDEIRRRKIRRTLSLEFLTDKRLEKEQRSGEGTTASTEVLAEEKRQVIRDALQKLSPTHRTVVVLREYDDLSYAEIAGVLGISVQAVKSRLFRAREELREYLKDYFEERV